MNSEEDISKAAESLVSTLKRLHDELLALDALLQEQGRSLYDAMTLEDWLDIIGVLSNLSERSGAISRRCLEIHFQVRSSSRGRSPGDDGGQRNDGEGRINQ
jgi:hypothetical protein